MKNYTSFSKSETQIRLEKYSFVFCRQNMDSREPETLFCWESRH